MITFLISLYAAARGSATRRPKPRGLRRLAAAGGGGRDQGGQPGGGPVGQFGLHDGPCSFTRFILIRHSTAETTPSFELVKFRAFRFAAARSRLARPGRRRTGRRTNVGLLGAPRRGPHAHARAAGHGDGPRNYLRYYRVHTILNVKRNAQRGIVRLRTLGPTFSIFHICQIVSYRNESR
jgi:hypothetical protein